VLNVIAEKFEALNGNIYVHRGHLEKNPELECLLPHIKNNVGFVFTKEELTVVR
jgi:hypothetical protein